MVQGDITQQRVDAIVNAANTSLRGGGGVDGAIHRAAGPELLEACRKLRGCPTGEAKATPGFRLPARFVFHAVGPIWRGGASKEHELLASCYRACFRLAKAHQVKTLAFPSISTGAYRFPLAEAAEIALREIASGLSDNPQLAKVLVVCFNEEVFQTYSKLLAAFTPRE